jgi:hypothetical protein
VFLDEAGRHAARPGRALRVPGANPARWALDRAGRRAVVAVTNVRLDRSSRPDSSGDLFYRLSVSPSPAPLRERRDILAAGAALPRQYTPAFGLAPELSTAAWPPHLDWPGNVRELRARSSAPSISRVTA